MPTTSEMRIEALEMRIEALEKHILAQEIKINTLEKAMEDMVAFLRFQKQLLIRKNLNFKKKTLTPYDFFCNDEIQRAQARQEVMDEADEEHEDELPTESEIQKKLASMWKDREDDIQFAKEHFESSKTKKQ